MEFLCKLNEITLLKYLTLGLGHGRHLTLVHFFLPFFFFTVLSSFSEESILKYEYVAAVESQAHRMNHNMDLKITDSIIYL